MADIVIIGAGPVGSHTAYLLSKKGHDVQLFEEHKRIGLPIQCTGIVTSAIKELIKPKKEFVLNKVNKVKVIAPNNKSIELSLKENELVLDRAKFDQYIYSNAVDSGAKSFLNHRFMDYKKGHVIIKDLKNSKLKKVKADILIGADGPLSPVAQKSGLFYNRRFFTGIQARVRIKNDPSIYSTFLGKKFPGFFGWCVPESDNIARIGLAAQRNAKYHFESFIKQFKGKIIEKQAGLIPVYNKNTKTQKNNVYLVGDAACQVKNTTGGGLIPGLICSKILVNSIISKKDYEKEWKKKIGRELYLHSKLRDCLNNFSDKDYSLLIKLLNRRKIKNVLENQSREFPSKLLSQLIIKEPRFLYFVKTIF